MTTLAPPNHAVDAAQRPSTMPPPQRAPWHRLPLVFMGLITAGLLAGSLVRPGKTNGAVQYLDDRVRSFVLGHRPTSWLDPLRSMAKVGATQNVIALAVVASLALLAWRKWRYALVPIVSVLGMDLMVAFLKHAIDRPGTKWHFPGAAAFPSGHMSGITALVVPFAVLAWTSRRQWWPAALAATAMLAMAVTLLVLDAHWFTDIVAGAVLTGTWATAVALWLPARPQRAERGRRAHYC